MEIEVKFLSAFALVKLSAAMDHWPERVKATCNTKKSLAFAHGWFDP